MFKCQFKTITALGFLLLANILIPQALTKAADFSYYRTSTDFEHSYNWSGYATSSDKKIFSSISGSWQITPATNTSSSSASTIWVGIGGLKKSDLIQAGTMTLIDHTGATSYIAWYELLPDSAKQIPIEIKPGDSVTVQLEEQTKDQWLIYFKNNTTDKSWQLSINYKSSKDSAEWIVEMPTLDRNQSMIPLSHFGTMSFDLAEAVVDGISKNVSEISAGAITMIDKKGQILAKPTPFGLNNLSFSVNRTKIEIASR